MIDPQEKYHCFCELAASFCEVEYSAYSSGATDGEFITGLDVVPTLR